MKLENRNPAKRNSKVSVNGHTYWVGHGGFIDDGEGNPVDVPKEDAEKLCQGKAWSELSWDPKDPANAGKLVPVSKIQAPNGALGRPVRSVSQMDGQSGIVPKTAAELGGQRVTAPTKDGLPPKDAPVENRLPTDEELAKAHAEDAKAAVEDAKRQGNEVDELGTGLLGHDGEEIPSTLTTGEIEAQVSPEESSGEWPDPTDTMAMPYLKKMADAYDVTYSGKIGKKALIKKIMAEMYEE